MRDEVKSPVTRDESTDDDADSPRAEEASSGYRCQDRPDDHHEKAVAPRIRLEGEMCERCVIGVHPHHLDPGEEKQWP